MKKTYNAPKMKVVKVKTAVGMLQASMDMNATTVRGSSALSRESGGSFWDDDEEDY